MDERAVWLWEIVNAAQSQANVVGLGAFIGFDYSSIQFLLLAKGIPVAMWDWVLEVLDDVTSIAQKYSKRQE